MIAHCVADDFSGANDCAGRFAGQGFRVWASTGLGTRPGGEVLLLNAATRFLGSKEARRASRLAWERLGACGTAQLYYQKMDSTLRGNPGHEILGLLEASGAQRIAFCPAYPRHGRVLSKGKVWVHGQPLLKSEYARDPLSPARCQEPARLFPRGLAQALPTGSPAVLRRLIRRSRSRILCFDARTDADMGHIARACLSLGIRHYAGASGLAAELAARLGHASKHKKTLLPSKRAVLAGSVSQTTLDAMDHLERSGLAPCFSLEDKGLPKGTLRRFALSSLRRRSQMARTAGEAAQRCFADQRLGRLLKTGLRLSGDPQKTLWLLTGGHTAELFYHYLGLEGNWVYPELLPGLPLLRAEGAMGRIWACSKPGGFGGPDLFERFFGLRR